MFDEIRPHIIELRKRLVICALVILVFFVASFNFWEIILDFITKPLVKVLPTQSQIIFTGITEAFFTAMKVSFFTSLLISMPIIFWQFWLFVAPGLYDNEKKHVIPFVTSATAMFIAGTAFCYYLVTPVAFEFLIHFGGKLFLSMPKINEYVGDFTKLIVAFGISFELPVITFFLAKIGVITDRSLSDFFRYAIVGIFIFAAVMTPPDILSQFMLAVPLIALYGISILIAKSVNPAPKMSQEDDNESAE